MVDTLHLVTSPSVCSSDLAAVRLRNIEELSGGELQRFACAVVCVQRADMYVLWAGMSSCTDCTQQT